VLKKITVLNINSDLSPGRPKKEFPGQSLKMNRNGSLLTSQEILKILSGATS
jgi:hypothetical protein